MIWNTVYEPAEDSFILLDTLLKDLKFLKESLKPYFCVEIGSGSGYIICSLANVLGNDTFYIATDINQDATRQTFKMAESNQVVVDVVCTDLLKGIENRVAGKVDLLFFNPPYVPTDEEEWLKRLVAFRSIETYSKWP